MVSVKKVPGKRLKSILYYPSDDSNYLYRISNKKASNNVTYLVCSQRACGITMVVREIERDYGDGNFGTILKMSAAPHNHIGDSDLVKKNHLKAAIKSKCSIDSVTPLKDIFNNTLLE